MAQEAAVRDPRLPRFPVAVKHPSAAQIRRNFSFKDYTQWGLFTAVSFPLGYVFGAQVDRSLRRPSMWVTGLLGCLGGFLFAYQNSSQRLMGYKANASEVRRFRPDVDQQDDDDDDEDDE